MIPAGYMFKRISSRPEWLKVENVRDIYSVSSCISENFADYISFWKHNGYWLFDSPDIMTALAKDQQIDLGDTTLLYYEMYEREYDEGSKVWREFKAEESFGTNVLAPHGQTLEGFDVVTFWAHSSPECSPLSCNSLGETIPVNEHCLLGSLDEAKGLLESGQFDNTEPGPLRIFAVYTVLP